MSQHRVQGQPTHHIALPLYKTNNVLSPFDEERETGILAEYVHDLQEALKAFEQSENDDDRVEALDDIESWAARAASVAKSLSEYYTNRTN